MGVLSCVWEGSVFGLLFVGAVFTGFVLRSLIQILKEAQLSVVASDPYEDGQSICACVHKRLDSFQLSKDFTLASVVCFFAGFFFSMTLRSVYFCVCDDCAMRSALFGLNGVCLISGYTLTYAAHFERLRLTFRDSPLQLPNWAPKVAYGTCLLFVLMMVAALGFRFAESKASSVFVVLAITLYFAGVSFLTRAFFVKATATANSQTPNTDTELLEVAVRITVVVAVSALSTVFAFLTYALIFGLCPMCYFWMTVFRVLLVADQCLNCFCLMCTFAAAVAPYKLAFGCLHSALLAHVSKTLRVPSIEMNVETG